MGGSSLEDLRRRIDAVDRELLKLIEERMRICEEIARVKGLSGRSLYDPFREAIVIERAGGYSRIYREIIEECKERQEKIIGSEENTGASPRLSKLFELYTRVKPRIRLDAGDLDVPPPIRMLRVLARELAGGLHYTLPTGSLEARESIANYYGVSRSNVIVTAGVKPVIAGLARLARASIVVVEPAYPGYRMAAGLFGKRVRVFHTVLEEGFEPDPEGLYHFVDPGDLVIVNSPNNPTGAVYTSRLRGVLRDLVIDKNAIILSDEAYQELDYTGEAPILALEHYENTVSAHSLSKIFSLPGLRAGYAIGDPELLRRIAGFQAATITCPSPLAEAAVKASLELLGERKQMLHSILKERIATVLTVLDHRLWDVVPPHGGLYLFPRNRRGVPGERIASILLEKYGVSIFPGVLFGRRYREHVRISLTAPVRALRSAVEALNSIVEEAGGNG